MIPPEAKESMDKNKMGLKGSADVIWSLLLISVTGVVFIFTWVYLLHDFYIFISFSLYMLQVMTQNTGMWQIGIKH